MNYKNISTEILQNHIINNSVNFIFQFISMLNLGKQKTSLFIIQLRQ